VNLITIGMARKEHPSIQQYSERLLTMRPFSQAALEGLATARSTTTITKPLRATAPSWWSSPRTLRTLVQLGVAEQKCKRLPEAPKPIRSRAHPSRRQAGPCEPGHRAAGGGRSQGGSRVL